MAPSSKSFNPNKHLKEEFVSNLGGSSMLEISMLLTIVPVIVLLRHSISSYQPTGTGNKDVSSKKGNASNCNRNLGAFMATITADFCLMVIPILLCFTVLSEWTYFVLVPLVLAVVIVAKRSYSPYPSKKISRSVRTDISAYRVATVVVTCLCILAVDFKIFPRNYAKTETYGTSLMDLGVGSFIVANALVSRQARNVSSANIKSALKATSPLILLGFGRLLSTSSVDYQVHVGEYGVHWNFFYTLAAVSILTSIIDIPPQYCGVFGIIILIGYQGCLLQGLNLYLLSSERGSDIISQNKEGIFSIFGYWGMYLIGVQLGHYLFFGNHVSGTNRGKQWSRRRLWTLAFLFWLLTIIVDKYVERVSRRMCNLAYVTFVFAQNLQVLAVFALSDLVGGSFTSALEDALDRNLLGSFLLVNLLLLISQFFRI
ncbi:hypothetical protein SAY86_025184 [Trapa natans]|uniref:GPI-anchored wall transfer protein n=1 Tax=Trapa natans TaxID=22666 RepID=A0AAN7RC52_TRANT|nr:hypothetical protein SAY86_025184 [Trapa natans]